MNTGKKFSWHWKNTSKLAEILNAHRKEPLDQSWLPIQLYCQKCGRDSGIEEQVWKEEKISYRCRHCQGEFCEEVRSSKCIKLPWRVDWPMRWSYEKVDFEPGGKDHSSQGGSYHNGKRDC